MTLQRNARLLRKMTEMQLLMTDASRKGLVSPQVLKEALELLKPGGKSKFIQAVNAAPPADVSRCLTSPPISFLIRLLGCGCAGEADRRCACKCGSTRRIIRRFACVHCNVARGKIENL